MKERVLVIGSAGQLGTELVTSLRDIYGESEVMASDIRNPENMNGPFTQLDILDKAAFGRLIQSFKPTQIYHFGRPAVWYSREKPKTGLDVEHGWPFSCVGCRQRE